MVITDTVALGELTQHLRHPYISNMAGVIQFVNPLELHRDQHWSAYLRERDQWGATNSIRPDYQRQAWVGVSTRLSWELFKRTYGTSRWCQIMRIVFDKHWTGHNQMKRAHAHHLVKCELCGCSEYEDQAHTIWSCTHPRLCEMRRIGLANLQRSVDHLSILPVGPTRDLILRLHTLLMSRQHSSLLVGRVHNHQRDIVENIIVPGDKVKRRQMIAHWRQYAAWAVTMFSTRQSIIDKAVRLKVDPTSVVIATIVLGRRGRRSLEVVAGIEKDTVITSSGEVVRSTVYDPADVIHADQRTSLDISNSLPLRELLTERTKPLQFHDPYRVRTASVQQLDHCPLLLAGPGARTHSAYPTRSQQTSQTEVPSTPKEDASTIIERARDNKNGEFGDLGYDPWSDTALMTFHMMKLKRPEPRIAVTPYWDRPRYRQPRKETRVRTPGDVKRAVTQLQRWSRGRWWRKYFERRCNERRAAPPLRVSLADSNQSIQSGGAISATVLGHHRNRDMGYAPTPNGDCDNVYRTIDTEDNRTGRRQDSRSNNTHLSCDYINPTSEATDGTANQATTGRRRMCTSGSSRDSSTSRGGYWSSRGSRSSSNSSRSTNSSHSSRSSSSRSCRRSKSRGSCSTNSGSDSDSESYGVTASHRHPGASRGSNTHGTSGSRYELGYSGNASSKGPSSSSSRSGDKALVTGHNNSSDSYSDAGSRSIYACMTQDDVSSGYSHQVCSNTSSSSRSSRKFSGSSESSSSACTIETTRMYSPLSGGTLTGQGVQSAHENNSLEHGLVTPQGARDHAYCPSIITSLPEGQAKIVLDR